MANRKIIEFPASSTIADNDVTVIADGTTGVLRKVPYSAINASMFQESATYAAIGSSTRKRLVFVTADETNNNDKTLYYHNGSTLTLILILP